MGPFVHDFMIRALIAGVLTGVLAPAVGTFIVQRRLSLLGDGLGHIAIAGVGLALLTGTAPLPIALVVVVLGAWLIEWLRAHGRVAADLGLAIIFYGGLALGVLMAGLAGRGAGVLSQYLFGSLTSVSPEEIWLVVILAVIVLVTVIGLRPQLFAVSIDEDFARTQGLPVGFYNFLLITMAALVVGISMRTVGLLLISALLVVPVAAAANIVTGLNRNLCTAMLIGGLVAAAGVTSSYWLDAPSGATIVLIAIVLFIVTVPLKPWRERRSRGTVSDAAARMGDDMSHERVRS